MSRGSAVGGLIALVIVVAAVLITPENWPACPTEDSTQCYWDASTSGNGEGTSFIALTDHIIIPMP